MFPTTPIINKTVTKQASHRRNTSCLNAWHRTKTNLHLLGGHLWEQTKSFQESEGSYNWLNLPNIKGNHSCLASLTYCNEPIHLILTTTGRLWQPNLLEGLRKITSYLPALWYHIVLFVSTKRWQILASTCYISVPKSTNTPELQQCFKKLSMPKCRCPSRTQSIQCCRTSKS